MLVFLKKRKQGTNTSPFLDPISPISSCPIFLFFAAELFLKAKCSQCLQFLVPFLFTHSNQTLAKSQKLLSAKSPVRSTLLNPVVSDQFSYFFFFGHINHIFNYGSLHPSVRHCLHWASKVSLTLSFPYTSLSLSSQSPSLLHLFGLTF